MTSYIPKLARISSRSRAAVRRQPAQHSETCLAQPECVNVEQIAGLVTPVRRRLGIPDTFSDEAILASLVSVASRSTYEARWRAARASTLAQFLCTSAADLDSAIVTLITLLPKPNR